MAISLEQLTRELQQALASARSMPPSASRGYWYHDPENSFPPRSIRYPDQYDGSDRLSIVCTQTDLPAKAQKDLVKSWCAILPSLGNVRFVWFHSKVPQELFDAACGMPNLEGIYVKWSSIHSIKPLLEPKKLTHVSIGSSPAISDVGCIESLTNLRWLELDNLKTVTDFSPFSGLSRLEGFRFTGAEGRQHTVSSFSPLSALTNLQWLHLGAMRSQDVSIRSLATLARLRWLGLGNFFSWQDFAWLSGQLPNTECTWFKVGMEPGIKCKRCKNETVLLSGKSMGSICPTCNADKWKKVSVAFAEAIAASSTES